MTPNSLPGFLKFLSIFQNLRQNDISSVSSPAVVTSYHLLLHIKMVASISQVSELLDADILRTRSDTEKRSTAFFPISSDLTSEINKFWG